MGFDYGYTCPDIDRGIESIKTDLESYLSDMLDECTPLLEGEVKTNFIKSYVDAMYQDFESNFEAVRSSNEDMRKEAENQIEDLESDLETEKDNVKDLEQRVEELEEQVDDLKNQLLDV